MVLQKKVSTMNYLADVNAGTLTVSLGQLITILSVLIGGTVTLVGFLMRALSLINDREKDIIRHDERIKVLEEHKSENNVSLEDIKETLGKMNIKIEILLSNANIKGYGNRGDNS